MDTFLVKYINGERGTLVADTTFENGIKKVIINPDNSFSNIEYIEINLNKEVIKFGDKGYYIVPAGHATCLNEDYGIGYFKERAECEYILKGTYLPVFAINHNNYCTVAIVTGFSSDVAQAVTIKDNTYDIKLRFMVNGEIPYENISIEFYDLSPNVTYCDIAKVYRNFQLKNGYKPLKERLTPELKYSLESPNIRIRMGWKPVPCTIAEQTPENEPPVYVACTFSDVMNLIESYHNAGIDKAELCLVGWNTKGHDGRWPQVFPVESSLGGEKMLRKLIAKAKEYGYSITCHTNSTDAYSIAENFNKDDLIVLKNGKVYERETRWAGGKTYELCPKKSYEYALEILPKIAALGFSGMHYIDVITCTPARVCYSKEHPVNKGECADYYDRIFKAAGKLFGSIGSENSYDYAMKHCDYTLYVSFADFTDEKALFPLCDKTIPFWQIVYHGIVASNPYARTVNPLASANKDDLLKLIEYGGKPQIYYYAQFVSDGTNWIGKGDFHCNTKEEIEDSTKLIKETLDLYKQLSYLQYEFIENHKEIAPNVFEITYSDSSVITVDYNKKTYSLTRK